MGMSTLKFDPWAAQDKTCIKCKKFVLDATKKLEKDAVIGKAKDITSARRQGEIIEADERYAKWIKLRNRIAK